MPATKPQSGFIDVRDTRTNKLVCRYNPQTREVEVVQRRDVRRGTLPDVGRVVQYARLVQEASEEG